MSFLYSRISYELYYYPFHLLLFISIIEGTIASYLYIYYYREVGYNRFDRPLFD